MTRVVAVMTVRNAVDVVRPCILHHLSLGVDRVLVTDNGSTDGTTDVLRALEREHPVDVRLDPGPFHQEAIVARMVEDARSANADWVLPVDADEFWTADGALADVLAAVPADAAAIACEVSNFVQHRRHRRPTEASLLDLTMRAVPSVPPARARIAVERGEAPFVGVPFPDKCVARMRPDLALTRGAHSLAAPGAMILPSSYVRVLHAPIRSRAVLDLRAEHGARTAAAGGASDHGWQSRRWHRLAQRGAALLDRAWTDNSHDGRSSGHPRFRAGLAEDPSLVALVGPWVASGVPA